MTIKFDAPLALIIPKHQYQASEGIHTLKKFYLVSSTIIYMRSLITPEIEDP